MGVQVRGNRKRKTRTRAQVLIIQNVYVCVCVYEVGVQGLTSLGSREMKSR